MAQGYAASGWDPYYSPDSPRIEADFVNLGFVINVIEDPVERADALTSAASLARRLLVVSVTLHNSAHRGLAHRDGVLSSRNTFQKYYSQDELRDYLEHALMLPVAMGAPRVALIFKDRDLEQRFLIERVRVNEVATRLLASVQVQRVVKLLKVRVTRPSGAQIRREELRPLISQLWQLALDLGRWQTEQEVPCLQTVEEKVGSLGRALRVVQSTCDLALLESASRSRRDDVLLFLAMQQFSKRPAYKRLNDRLERDVKCFFGTYGAAYTAAARLLRDTANSEKLLEVCRFAASHGLGHLDADRALQLHIAMVDRLPAILRAYIACGLVLWDETSAVQLMKVHIGSGKLTLLEFEDFDGQWLPRLQRRVKINLRRLEYDIFEYGNAKNPCPMLFHKSRYMNEEYLGFEEQQRFEAALASTGLVGAESVYAPSEAQLDSALELRRLMVGASGLEPSDRIPPWIRLAVRIFHSGALWSAGKPSTARASTTSLSAQISRTPSIRLRHRCSTRSLNTTDA